MSGETKQAMSLCQVALSVAELGRSHQWYRKALGLLSAGDRRRRFGDSWARVPGLPEASFDVWCVVDGQAFFQFEMFEFRRPRMKPLPVSWRRCDIGYATIGIHVADFDAALDSLQRTSGRLLGGPIGAKGSRRVCLLDPDGILLELMEDDPCVPRRDDARSAASCAVCSISVSVPDLGRAYKFWAETLWCGESAKPLHSEVHETLWGLEGAARESVSLRSGDFVVELVQYTDPLGNSRPAGRLISDQGILNVALGTTDRKVFDETYERVIECGYSSNTAPWVVPDVATVVYLNDDQGFSVELLCVEPQALRRMGFIPSESMQR